MDDMGENRLYTRSDGGLCTASELWHQFESGAWKPFCWETESNAEWVETEAGELIVLEPVTETAFELIE